MNLSARTVFVTLAAAIVGVAAAIGAVKFNRLPVVELAPAAERRREPVEPANPEPVGMAGCLAAACHGVPAGKLLRGEYDEFSWRASGSCWTAADPHTAAYRVLDGELARRIMAKYNPGVAAARDVRCLACHTNPALATEDHGPAAVALREQGVSCEGCHGNAGRWLQPHTAWSDKGDRTKLYADTGMTKLYDLGERALNCAGCHVGAPAADGLPVRDMNHDMIAAGHPRLDFDFAEYQRRLPRHWQEKDRVSTDDKGRPRPVDRNALQMWYVGRLAHAEAACELLASRATRAKQDLGRPADDTRPRTPWPEFAESACYACHHNLLIPGDKGPKGEAANGDSGQVVADWRKDAAHLGGRPLGSTPWQTIWPVTSAPGLKAPTRDGSAVAALVKLMEGETGETNADGRPKLVRFPQPDAAAQRALGTAKALSELRKKAAHADGAAVADEARGFFRKGKDQPWVTPPVREWDTARQLFYGLVAVEYARAWPGKAAEGRYGKVVEKFRARGPSPDSAADWAEVLDAMQALP